MTAKYYDKSTKTGVASDSMSTLASLPQTMQQGAMGLLADGTVIYAGGHSGSKVSRKAWIYTPGSDSWAAIADMPIPVDNPNGIVLDDGRFMIVTGFKSVSESTSAEVNLDSALVYNPTTGAWSTYAHAADPGAAFGACCKLSDGRIFICGGIATGASTSSPCLTNAQIFDPTTNTWTQVSSMPTGRRLHNLVTLPNGKVLVVGGRLGINNSANTSATCAIYDPMTDTWSTAGSMNNARAICAVAVHPSATKVGVVAGTNASGGTRTCEVYDIATDTWTNASGLVQNVSGGAYEPQGFALLPDGRLFCYGVNGSARLTTDVLDMIAGSVAAGPAFPSNRVFNAGMVLPDGRCMTVGGSDGGSVLATVAVLSPALVRVTHGLQSASGLAPHLVIPEFTADPGASARVWSGEKGSTYATVGTTGLSSALRVHSWRFHSVID